MKEDETTRESWINFNWEFLGETKKGKFYTVKFFNLKKYK